MLIAKSKSIDRQQLLGNGFNNFNCRNEKKNRHYNGVSPELNIFIVFDFSIVIRNIHCFLLALFQYILFMYT